MPIQLADKLAGIHPDLRQKVERILAAMLALGFPMFVVAGVRTTEQQQKLYAQGRSLPGKTVTNCDGVIKKSDHQPKADGFGHAVDCAFVNDPNTPLDETWSDKSPWKVYGEMAKALELEWGGDWAGLLDRPHIATKSSRKP